MSEKTKSEFRQAMQAHGFKKGPNKRHPATSHYKGKPVDQAAYRKFK